MQAPATPGPSTSTLRWLYGRDGVIRLTAATTAAANGVLLDLAAGKLHEIPVVLAAATISA